MPTIPSEVTPLIDDNVSNRTSPTNSTLPSLGSGDGGNSGDNGGEENGDNGGGTNQPDPTEEPKRTRTVSIDIDQHPPYVIPCVGDTQNQPAPGAEQTENPERKWMGWLAPVLLMTSCIGNSVKSILACICILPGVQAIIGSVSPVFMSVAAILGWQRLNEVHQRVTEVNQRVTVVNQRVTEVNRRVTEVNHRVTEVNQRVTEVNHRVTEINQRVTGVDQRVINLEQTVNTRFDQMISRFDQVQEQLDVVLGRV
jgi:flagellar capping protein FliD